MAGLPLRWVGWFFALLVLGSYTFSMEAALFVPTDWRVSNILSPVPMALLAWFFASEFWLIVEIGARRWSGVLLSLGSLLAFAFVVTKPFRIGLIREDGLYLILTEVDPELRLAIGIVLFLACAYLVASPWLWMREQPET